MALCYETMRSAGRFGARPSVGRADRVGLRVAAAEVGHAAAVRRVVEARRAVGVLVGAVRVARVARAAGVAVAACVAVEAAQTVAEDQVVVGIAAASEARAVLADALAGAAEFALVAAVAAAGGAARFVDSAAARDFGRLAGDLAWAGAAFVGGCLAAKADAVGSPGRSQAHCRDSQAHFLADGARGWRADSAWQRCVQGQHRCR